MKIIVINQHSSNHGDEAAGKGLVRSLLSQVEVDKLTVMYIGELNEMIFFNDKNKKTQNRTSKIQAFSNFRSVKFKVNFNLYLIFKLPPIVRKLIRRILFFIIDRNCYYALDQIYKNDIVISAPSGPNIGNNYKDYVYLWKIFSAIKLKKRVFIYSPSVGKLDGDSNFEKIAKYILKNVEFISIRDNISFNHLEEIKFSNYYKSIDTAFLDKHIENALPVELSFLKESQYIVFVPNQLYKWHPNYLHNYEKTIDSFYFEIIKKFSGYKIIMLPQLFGFQNDEKYFSSLCSKFTENEIDIRIINQSYSSDIQQLIIRNSIFVIGARYHSIIFAIKNQIPFYSLSYEHKMSGMLELLELSEFEYKFSEDINKENIQEIISNIYKVFNNRQNNKRKVEIAKNKASKIADNTFSSFKNVINN